jgi:hypothetical protein
MLGLGLLLGTLQASGQIGPRAKKLTGIIRTVQAGLIHDKLVFSTIDYHCIFMDYTRVEVGAES